MDWSGSNRTGSTWLWFCLIETLNKFVSLSVTLNIFRLIFQLLVGSSAVHVVVHVTKVQTRRNSLKKNSMLSDGKMLLNCLSNTSSYNYISIIMTTVANKSEFLPTARNWTLNRSGQLTKENKGRVEGLCTYTKQASGYKRYPQSVMYRGHNMPRVMKKIYTIPKSIQFLNGTMKQSWRGSTSSVHRIQKQSNSCHFVEQRVHHGHRNVSLFTQTRTGVPVNNSTRSALQPGMLARHHINYWRRSKVVVPVHRSVTLLQVAHLTKASTFIRYWCHQQNLVG